jgi:hypothetical protein
MPVLPPYRTLTVQPLVFYAYAPILSKVFTRSPKSTFLHQSPPVYTNNYVLAPGLL